MKSSEMTAAEQVLRSYGFSRAWALDNDDPNEEVFLVLPKELAQVDEREVTIKLMEVLPRRKVWVAAHVPIETTVIY